MEDEGGRGRMREEERGGGQEGGGVRREDDGGWRLLGRGSDNRLLYRVAY